MSNEQQKEPAYQLFEVAGAGKLKVSEGCHAHTGQAVGFSIGVSWGRYGYSGGVIGRGEAVRLAHLILAACEGVEETEQEESDRRYRTESF